MTYADAVAHLYALGPELVTSSGPTMSLSGDAAPAPKRKFDLAHMRVLCAALGNPHDRVPSVLIAGTNGKGSTAATLASILNAAGYRTGLYTSPHLVAVNERIQCSHPVLPSEYGSATVHGADGALALGTISDQDFADLYTQVDSAGKVLVADGKLPATPSFFERLTAVAFLFFAGSHSESQASRAEIMILEVGLGGRLDATNIVEPLLSIITDISLDHQDYLGSTIAEIAREKCGIMRRHGTLITLPQLQETNQVIGEVATALDVRAINAAAYMPEPARNVAPGNAPQGASREGVLLARNAYVLHIDHSGEREVIRVDSPLLGVHQQRNLALAIAGAIELRNQTNYKWHGASNSDGYNISNSAIEEGIRTTDWPGRLEWMLGIEPNLLLDVAHNPAGAWTLRSALASLPESIPRTLIFSCLRDKSLLEMSRILFPLFDAGSGEPLRKDDHIILAPIANPRASSVDELIAAAHALDVPAHAAPHLAAALAQARQVTPPGGIIVATGSVYLVGDIRNLVQTEMRRSA